MKEREDERATQQLIMQVKKRERDGERSMAGNESGFTATRGEVSKLNRDSL